jgi:hypothetical protein
VDQIRPLAQVLEPTSQALAGTFSQLQPEVPQLNRMTALAARPQCLTYIGQFLNRVISLTKFGDGKNNIANARADVTLDFGNVKGARNPAWRISPICYQQSGATAR